MTCCLHCRHHPQSEAEDTARAHRQVGRGAGTSQGGSPHLTPRSTHAAPSDNDDKEEEERPQARRKKIGDEPPSRQRSAPEQDDSQGNFQLAIPFVVSFLEMNGGSVLTDRLCF